MRRVVLVVPGPLETRTGGSIYDRRIAEGLRARGWTVDVHELEGPTARVLRSLETGAVVLIDGLLFGAMPDEAEHAAARLKMIAVVHLPLAEAPGLSADAACGLERGEQRSLACAAAVVVTGRGAAATVERYGVPSDRIVLIEPGTDRAPVARGSDGSRVECLCVATLNAGKGHDMLLRALSRVHDPAWHLTCAGSLDRDPVTAGRVAALADGLGLGERVTLAGELEDARLFARYDRADLFVLASLHETYGMAVAEALARGLPVVATATGAIPELVGDGAGLVVPPGDEEALAAALERTIADRDLRSRLAAGARAARANLPPWDRAIDRFEMLIQHVIAT